MMSPHIATVSVSVFGAWEKIVPSKACKSVNRRVIVYVLSVFGQVPFQQSADQREELLRGVAEGEGKAAQDETCRAQFPTERALAEGRPPRLGIMPERKA